MTIVVASTSAALSPEIVVGASPYNCVPDTKTLPDGVIAASSTALTSASAAFVPADVGKTIVLNGAGATPATTSTAVLSTVVATTAIPVNALPIAMPGGTVTISSGGNTFVGTTSGAAAGATSIPLLGAPLMTFAFPSGSTVVSLTGALKTTIFAYVSATAVTLAAPAVTACTSGSPSEVVYGTNNYAGLQQAFNDGIAGNTSVRLAGGSGEGYLYDGTLVVNGNLDIVGTGAHETFGARALGYAACIIPCVAPYLKGAVLVCAAQNADAVQITGIAASGSPRDFGVRFAGKLLNTGHGFNAGVPGSGTVEQGIKGAWTSLKVYGHDGMHYAFNLVNSCLCTFHHLRGYGGGGINLVNNSSFQGFGNNVFVHPYMAVFAAGTANAFTVTNTAQANVANLWVRPQGFLLAGASYTPSVPQAAGASAYAQVCMTVVGGGNFGTMLGIDMEGINTTASPGSGAQLVGGGIGSVGFNYAVNAASGAAIQNTQGANIDWMGIFDVTPLPGSAGSLVLSSGPSTGTQYPMSQDIVPAGAAPSPGTLSALLSTGAPITALPVNALTLAVGAGAITVYSGSNSQTFQTTGAALGATSIPITSATPNFAYPSSSVLLSPLRRTIRGIIVSANYMKVIYSNAVLVATNSVGTTGS